jgi:hypothetical protein
MTTIHLVSIADTNDYSIGESCHTDQNRLMALLQSTAVATDSHFESVLINGDDFTAECINEAIEHVDSQPNDTVIFQYAGHGARGESKSDPWPVLALGSRSDTGAHEVLDIGSIYSRLRERNPRMLMVLADCCNEILPDNMLTEIAPKSTGRSRSDHEIANLAQLFLKYSGEVLGMGSKPGTLAYGINGGVFTTQTLTAIELAVGHSSNRSWKHIMDEAARSMNVLGQLGIEAQQTPVWRVTEESGNRSPDATPPGLRSIEDGWVVGSLSDQQAEPIGSSQRDRAQRQEQRQAQREAREAERLAEREERQRQRQERRERR